MRVPPFLILVLVGSTPIIIVGLVLTAGNVELAAWRPPLAWSEQYGTAGAGVDNSVSAIAADSSGGYAAGILDLANSNNATSGTLFVRSYYPGGNTIWNYDQRRISFDTFTGLSLGPDGVYVRGDVNGSISILKLGLNGNMLWTRQVGTDATGVGGVYTTTLGAYIAGTVSHPITSQSFTGAVMFVREYDLAGNVVWTSEFSNSTNASFMGIYATSSGVYLLTDRFLVKYDPNGNQLWTIAGGGFGISGDGSGVYVAGPTQFNRFTPPPKGFLTKYRSDGSVDWTTQFDVADHSGVDDPQVSADSSGVYMSVRSINGHAYIFKFDGRGNQLWSFEPPLSRTNGVVSSRIAVGPQTIYWGGSIPAVTAHSYAFLEGIGKDASVIFFGLQPPWSFILIGGLGAFVTVSIFWQSRRKRRLMKSRVMQPEKILPSGVPKD